MPWPTFRTRLRSPAFASMPLCVDLASWFAKPLSNGSISQYHASNKRAASADSCLVVAINPGGYPVASTYQFGQFFLKLVNGYHEHGCHAVQVHRGVLLAVLHHRSLPDLCYQFVGVRSQVDIQLQVRLGCMERRINNA